MTPSQAIKTLVRCAVAAVAPTYWRLLSEPRLVILMYHRVLPRGHAALASEQPGMYVHPDTLERNIKWLREIFEIVHLDEWVVRAQAGIPVPKLAAAITFDDGWADNFEFAFPILKRLEVPATIFVCPELVDGNGEFWPTTLARLLSRGVDPSILPVKLSSDVAAAGVSHNSLATGLDQVQIDRLINICKRRSDMEMRFELDAVREADQEIGNLLGRYSSLMTWAQMQVMQSTGLVKFGSHTSSHLRLACALSARQLEYEIGWSRLNLEDHLGRLVTSFAYPNGDMAEDSIREVRRHYQLAVTTRRGCTTRKSEPWLLPRMGMQESIAWTRCSFLSRISNVG